MHTEAAAVTEEMKPWALSAQDFASYAESLPEDSPMKGVSRRSAVIRALISGEEVPDSVAADFPDIVQVGNPESIPQWVMTCLRRPSKNGSGRYVLAGGSLFHVYPVQNSYLVSKASFFAPGNRVVHEPFSLEAEDQQRAIAMYEQVMRFISKPLSAKPVIERLHPDFAVSQELSRKNKRPGV